MLAICSALFLRTPHWCAFCRHHGYGDPAGIRSEHDPGGLYPGCAAAAGFPESDATLDTAGCGLGGIVCVCGILGRGGCRAVSGNSGAAHRASPDVERNPGIVEPDHHLCRNDSDYGLYRLDVYHGVAETPRRKTAGNQPQLARKIVRTTIPQQRRLFEFEVITGTASATLQKRGGHSPPL